MPRWSTALGLVVGLASVVASGVASSTAKPVSALAATPPPDPEAEAAVNATGPRRSWSNDTRNLAKHPLGRRALVVWMLAREVGVLYVPGFGVLADYVGLALAPVVSPIATSLAKRAEYQKPLSRREKKQRQMRRVEAEAWRELDLSTRSVDEFLATPYDRFALVSDEFVVRHELGSGKKRGSLRKHVVQRQKRGSQPRPGEALGTDEDEEEDAYPPPRRPPPRKKAGGGAGGSEGAVQFTLAPMATSKRAAVKGRSPAMRKSLSPAAAGTKPRRRVTKTSPASSSDAVDDAIVRSAVSKRTPPKPRSLLSDEQTERRRSGSKKTRAIDAVLGPAPAPPPASSRIRRNGTGGVGHGAVVRGRSSPSTGPELPSSTDG